MKKSLITTLVAVPLLSLSSFALAAPAPAEQSVTLTAAEMDSVTAGQYNWSNLFQINVSPITVVQLNILGNSWNMADIVSGNIGSVAQH